MALFRMYVYIYIWVIVSFGSPFVCWTGWPFRIAPQAYLFLSFPSPPLLVSLGLTCELYRQTERQAGSQRVAGRSNMVLEIIRAGFGLAKGAFDLGVGVYSYLNVRSAWFIVVFIRACFIPLDSAVLFGGGGAVLGVVVAWFSLQNEISLAEIVEDMTVDVGKVDKHVRSMHRDVTKGFEHTNDNVRAVREDVTHLRRDVNQVRDGIKRAQEGIETILDNQASLVALFNEGEVSKEVLFSSFFLSRSLIILPPQARPDQEICAFVLPPRDIYAESVDICERLDSLEKKITRGVQDVIGTLNSQQAAAIDNKFKEKLDLVTTPYKELVHDITEAAGNMDHQYSSLAGEIVKENAIAAEKRADELHAWAKSNMPKAVGNSHVDRNKPKKIKMMPYIVAMAYAVRVKVDARMVKVHSMPAKGGEREKYLERNRKFIDDIVKLLREKITEIVDGASLLEIALDYYLVLATYAMLITSLQASVPMMVKPETTVEGEKIQGWDDGLSDIR